jgi:transcriptional regulator with XRE-family HTH domain
MIDASQLKEITARKLKSLRKGKGWTQQQLSNKIKIDRDRYANYELARRIAPHRVIVAVCNAYGITVEEFEN